MIIHATLPAADRLSRPSGRIQHRLPRLAGDGGVLRHGGVLLGFGFYGHGVYLAELQKIHGWPNSLISGASTAYYLCSAVLLTFVADAMARLGPRAVVLGGTACFAVSASLLPFITEPWHLYADYLLMAAGWATMSIAGIVTILGMWFDSRRGLAISLALNGASFGGVVLAPALAAGSAHYGFASSMLTAVAIMLVVLVPFAVLVISRPPTGLRPDQETVADERIPATTTSRPLKKRRQ